ncbi:MAG: hypothetical protein II480_04230, partial [Bacteroidales bacterium]|nr:hypothetical protein [Bacteroidales bacterium]
KVDSFGFRHAFLPSLGDVVRRYAYDVAKARQKGMSKSKTIYLIIGVVGILMFFVPERQAINTIEGTKNIVNKIINH